MGLCLPYQLDANPTSWNQRWDVGVPRHSPNHIHMICLGERWKTTLKSFGSCIGGMVFKPFWHTAKLCLVLTKTSACLTRLKVLRPRGSAKRTQVGSALAKWLSTCVVLKRFPVGIMTFQSEKQPNAKQNSPLTNCIRTLQTRGVHF